MGKRCIVISAQMQSSRTKKEICSNSCSLILLTLLSRFFFLPHIKAVFCCSPLLIHSFAFGLFPYKLLGAGNRKAGPVGKYIVPVFCVIILRCSDGYSTNLVYIIQFCRPSRRNVGCSGAFCLRLRLLFFMELQEFSLEGAWGASLKVWSFSQTAFYVFEDSSFQGCETVQSGRNLLSFRRHIISKFLQFRHPIMTPIKKVIQEQADYVRCRR